MDRRGSFVLERLWLIGWVVSAVLAAVIYSEFVAHVFVAEYADASEKNCRSQEQARIAKQRSAPQENQIGASPQETQDTEKSAREYCVQRRSAIAAERQAYAAIGGLLVGFAALVAAALAAGAALSTVAKMDDTAKRQLRAYVSVEPEGIRPMARTLNIIGHVSIKNTGNLPATKVSWLINMRDSGNPKLDAFEPKEADARGGAVIFPKTTIYRGSGQNIMALKYTPEDEKPRPRFIYVWGAVYYTDGYGVRRWTKFCHRYNCEASKFVGMSFEIPTDTARYHEYGNDAD